MRVLYFSDNGSDHNRRFLEKISSFGHEVWFLDLTGQPSQFSLPPGVSRVKPKRTFPRDAAPSEVGSLFYPNCNRGCESCSRIFFMQGQFKAAGYLGARSGFHPLVVMSWGSDLMMDAEKDAVWRHATEVALRGADGFACDCDAVRWAGMRYASFSPGRIAQFPWGVKRGVFSPVGDKPSDWRPAAQTITFLCTRSWEPLYDIDVLLNALRRGLRTKPESASAVAGRRLVAPLHPPVHQGPETD